MAAITIGSCEVQGWQGASTGIQLRILFNQAFTGASGIVYPATNLNNPAGLGSFYEVIPVTVNGTLITIPTISLESTVDSPDNPSATYSAVFFDPATSKVIGPMGTYASFQLPASPTSTSWPLIFAAQSDH